jgi:hypothetical protein
MGLSGLRTYIRIVSGQSLPAHLSFGLSSPEELGPIPLVLSRFLIK